MFGPIRHAALAKFWIDDVFEGVLGIALLAFSRIIGWLDRYLVDGVLNVLSAWTVTRRRRAADDADRPRAGLRLRRRRRPARFSSSGCGGRSRDRIPRSLGDDLGAVRRARSSSWRSRAIGRCSCAGRRSLGATVSLVASLWVYWAYDRAAAGFQFQEQFELVPSLGISYLLAIDGMSALMCLLTSIIIFAGVFASWTVKERSQEFYALLLLLVTGVYGVFVSLDLFVFFLFYEIAVLPMYLLIGIWGSTGEVRPQGIFGWAMGRTGVGTKEYAAMKLTLYLLFGSAFILVGILALYVAGGSRSVLVPGRSRRCSSIPRCRRGCSSPSTSGSASSPASGRCTPGRRTATRRRRPPCRCSTPAC